MTAGRGSAWYSAGLRALGITAAAPLVVAVLIVALALSIAWQRPAAASVAPLPGWSKFQADCQAGPSPGQGNTPESCVCWEANLRAEAIRPTYAVHVLEAVQVAGGEADTVRAKLGFGSVGMAMDGCWLYTGFDQQRAADQAVWPGV